MIIHGENQKIGCFYKQTTLFSSKNGAKKMSCQVWDTELKDGRICALWRCWIDRMALIRFRLSSLHISPHPSPLLPHPSAFIPPPSAFTPQPSPLTPHPSSLTPQPSSLLPQPSPLTPPPSSHITNHY